MVNFDLNARALSSAFIVFLMTSGFILSFWYTFRNPIPPEMKPFTESQSFSTSPRKTSSPSETTEDRVSLYSRHLAQGQNYLKTQQLEQAEEELESALRILDSADVRRALSETKFLQEKQLAETALQAEQLEEAVLHLKKALSLQDHENLRLLLSTSELKLQTRKLEQQNKEEREHWLQIARNAVQDKQWEKALDGYARVHAFGNMEDAIAQEIQQLQKTLEDHAEEERFRKSWEQAQLLLKQDWQNGLVFLSQLQKQFPRKKGEIAFHREQIIQEKLTEILIEVPGGTYAIGSSLSEDEQPVHQVTLPPFKIDRFPVTHWQYALFINETGYPAPDYWLHGVYPAEEEWFPVVQVNFEDATAFARWAKKRLPTEFEWEAAARTIEGFTYPWGNAPEKKRSNHRESLFQATCSVKEFPPNALGIYDLVGNISQWTHSFYEGYPGNKTFLSTEKPLYRTIRGGSFLLTVEHLRGSNRFYESPQARLPSLGFRCARSIP